LAEYAWSEVYKVFVFSVAIFISLPLQSVLYSVLITFSSNYKTNFAQKIISPSTTIMQITFFSVAFLICQIGSIMAAPVAVPAPAPVDGDLLKARIVEPIVSARDVVGPKYHGVVQSGGP
jgi:hypothetical protein